MVKFIVFAIFALVLCMSPLLHFTTMETVVFTVKSLDRQCSGGEQVECKYMVFTHAEVFENTDSLWAAKFNSSDIQNSLSVGDRYIAEVNGFRIPILSSYRNILHVIPAK